MVTSIKPLYNENGKNSKIEKIKKKQKIKFYLKD